MKEIRNITFYGKESLSRTSVTEFVFQYMNRNPLKQGSHYVNRVLHAYTVDPCSWIYSTGPHMLVAWSHWTSQWKKHLDEPVPAAQLFRGHFWCTNTVTFHILLTSVLFWAFIYIRIIFKMQSTYYSAGTALVTLELTPKQI